MSVAETQRNAHVDGGVEIRAVLRRTTGAFSASRHLNFFCEQVRCLLIPVTLCSQTTSSNAHAPSTHLKTHLFPLGTYARNMPAISSRILLA